MNVGDRVQFKQALGPGNWQWNDKLIGTVTRDTGLSVEAVLDSGETHMDTREHCRPVNVVG